MLTAHETIKTAWSNLKAYPRLQQLVLYNFVVLLPILFTTLIFGENEEMTNIAHLVTSVPSMVFYFLTFMVTAHYVCSGWVFNSFLEFLRPPSSLWRLFWKSIVLTLLVIIPIILIFGGVGATIAMKFLSSVGIVSALFGLFIFIVVLYIYTKLLIIYPYLSMNDNAPLFAPLRFSNGYFWYLLKILGWMSLYGILVLVMVFIGLFIFGFVEAILGTVGVAIATCCCLLLQVLGSVIFSFIFAEAYKQIAENKS